MDSAGTKFGAVELIYRISDSEFKFLVVNQYLQSTYGVTMNDILVVALRPPWWWR